ncbi:hypothetical protein GXW71_22730 [Roseomonas hellenica]|uniref:Uncharacterized protein n=1 Tax=Plastoroseomonas hellenica TaxID=2687306 RepID=A0ABS5F400_9PROT|nr:hypothetical protein [Plastoroseomonas hellenica]MBR0667193.1 hypothetical protein [Plastoroseomonas hellenica]
MAKEPLFAASDDTSFEASIEEPEPGSWRASFVIRKQGVDGEDTKHGVRTFGSEAGAEEWLWSIAHSLGFNTIMLSRPPRRLP